MRNPNLVPTQSPLQYTGIYSPRPATQQVKHPSIPEFVGQGVMYPPLLKAALSIEASDPPNSSITPKVTVAGITGHGIPDPVKVCRES